MGEIEKRPGSDEGYSVDHQQRIRAASALEKLLQAFVKNFPSHSHADDAREMQTDLLSYLASLGAKPHQEVLNAREFAALENPNTSQAERLTIQLDQISRKAFAITETGKYDAAKFMNAE